MGKTRRQKVHSKINPLGIPSLREVEQDEDYFSEIGNYPGGPVQAILDQLQSGNLEEKMTALQSLATLGLNPEKAKSICLSEIVRVTAPLLMDTNQAVRNATVGALRNLSINGVSICENLVEQDVLTPLLVLLTEYSNSSDWIPTFDQTMKNQLDQKSDTFLHAIHLLWNLCESTSVALDNFNQSQILPSFIRCLNYDVFGIDISIAVAQCLLVISEDNPNSWCILSRHVLDIVSKLSIDGGISESLLRTLIAGIISNVPALSAAYSNQIFTAVTKTLEINHRIILGQITSKLPLCDDLGNKDETNVGNSLVMEDESEEDAIRRRRRQDLPSEIEVETRNVSYLLQAQRVAAETITNMCSPDEETDTEDNEDDNISDSESVQDYDVSNDGSSSQNLQNIDKLPVEILEAIKSFGLIEKLWLKAQPIPENVDQILQQFGNDLWKRVKGLRVAALLCLQNLCNIMATDDLGGPDAVYGVWLDLGQQVFQGQQDLLIIEGSTSLMRAALEHLKCSPELFKQMTENDLQLMLNGVQNCSVAEIRANWLRMLGILGCLLPETLVKIIITFVLDICMDEDDAWTLSEAIDALMDMFSDNDWNNIVYDLNMCQKSKQLKKIFKTKIRQQKHVLKDRYAAVLTVQNNLQRFTKYIENQMKEYRPT